MPDLGEAADADPSAFLLRELQPAASRGVGGWECFAEPNPDPGRWERGADEARVRRASGAAAAAETLARGVPALPDGQRQHSRKRRRFLLPRARRPKRFPLHCRAPANQLELKASLWLAALLLGVTAPLLRPAQKAHVRALAPRAVHSHHYRRVREYAVVRCWFQIRFFELRRARADVFEARWLRLHRPSWNASFFPARPIRAAGRE